jgi:hypothetical protein
VITRMSQLRWHKRSLERIGTPRDIEYTGWLHKAPTSETIERAYAAALHAFELGLPIESIHAECRMSQDAKATRGGYLWGDLPAGICVMLGRFWTAKHTSLWITFEADGSAVARAFRGYEEKGMWREAFTEALWPRIVSWLSETSGRPPLRLVR